MDVSRQIHQIQISENVMAVARDSTNQLHKKLVINNSR